MLLVGSCITIGIIKQLVFRKPKHRRWQIRPRANFQALDLAVRVPLRLKLGEGVPLVSGAVPFVSRSV